jgi:hypothetical protein
MNGYRITNYPGVTLSGYFSYANVYPDAFHINNADNNELHDFYGVLNNQSDRAEAPAHTR